MQSQEETTRDLFYPSQTADRTVMVIRKQSNYLTSCLSRISHQQSQQ